MVVRDVLLSDLVYHACLQHALSTEREEILGMLMGDVTSDGRAAIWGSSAVPRVDKRPDRVEVLPEQMIRMADEAESITCATRRRTRVIGWYHSHPRITPYPSHVDLNTQATCQAMERCWVGLIFSVFHSDPNSNRNRITLHSFATLVDGDGRQHHAKVPVRVVPSAWLDHTLGLDPAPAGASPFVMLSRLPALLWKEEEASIAAARARVEAAAGVAVAVAMPAPALDARSRLDRLFGDVDSAAVRVGPTSSDPPRTASATPPIAVAHFDELASHAAADANYHVTQLLIAEGVAAVEASCRAQEARIAALEAALAVAVAPRQCRPA